MKKSSKGEKISKANKEFVKKMNESVGEELYEVYEERHNGVLYVSRIQMIKEVK